jgi:hypothetical protein
MSSSIASSADDKQIHDSAYSRLHAKLKDQNIVDYDPNGYKPEDAFKKLFELRELTLAFETYLRDSNSISLLTAIEENWNLSLSVKFP